MKSFTKFQASRIADFVRVNFDRIEYSDLITSEILSLADSEGMIAHSTVSDTIGSDWMREIEASCVMYLELERA